MSSTKKAAFAYDLVVVNYQSTDFLLELLADLKRLTHPPTGVYVVDNASTDNPRRMLEVFPEVNLTLVKSNLGFGRAANIGWRQGKSPLVMFINPDSRLLDQDYSNMLKYLHDNPQVGAVGPKILDVDGGIQGSARGFHSFWTIFAGRKGPLTRLFPNSSMVQRDVPIMHSDGVSPLKVDWLSGACLAVRRRDLMRISGFDECYFMYFEDTDLCLELMELGLETHYYPQSVISHQVAGSSPKKAINTALWFHQSCYRYLRKHYFSGSFWSPLLAAQLIALRFVLVAGSCFLSNLLSREQAASPARTQPDCPGVR